MGVSYKTVGFPKWRYHHLRKPSYIECQEDRERKKLTNFRFAQWQIDQQTVGRHKGRTISGYQETRCDNCGDGCHPKTKVDLMMIDHVILRNLVFQASSAPHLGSENTMENHWLRLSHRSPKDSHGGQLVNNVRHQAIFSGHFTSLIIPSKELEKFLVYSPKKEYDRIWSSQLY